MRRHRNAKVVATLGPASSNYEVIRQLFEAGADVFRLNFSHGSHEDHRRTHEYLRILEAETGKSIGILMDLQGPKLRVGKFAEGPIELKDGQNFRFDLLATLGDNTRVSLPHPEIFAALRVGSDLLLDDGRLKVQVTAKTNESLDTRVIIGGILSDRKGVNVPGVSLPISPLTAKDRLDLEFGLQLGVDWVALSFVQRPEDIIEARGLIKNRAKIAAKIEKPMAIQYLEEIIKLSDALMVARGDLGVEMLPEEVPGVQKRIVRECRRMGRPVIVATQMLDSMVASPSPTRAEASDVATAIFDGADAVMLSAESASGKYPVESVQMMNRIICQVEQDPMYRAILEAGYTPPEKTVATAMAASARQVAHLIPISAVVTFTNSGSTPLAVARERPASPILGLTPDVATARQLALVWGVHPLQTTHVDNFSEMTNRACELAVQQGFAQEGQHIAVIAGVPFRIPGGTNILHVARVGGELPS